MRLFSTHQIVYTFAYRGNDNRRFAEQFESLFATLGNFHQFLIDQFVGARRN